AGNRRLPFGGDRGYSNAIPRVLVEERQVRRILPHHQVGARLALPTQFDGREVSRAHANKNTARLVSDDHVWRSSTEHVRRDAVLIGTVEEAQMRGAISLDPQHGSDLPS